MAEHVNNQNLFGSGGHTWVWQDVAAFEKRLSAIGCKGEARIVTALGSRPGQICGSDGGPALLKASGASQTAAGTALSVLENAIISLKRSGAAVSWTDDAGRSGDFLVIMEYIAAGPREFGKAGSTYQCWQFYTCRVLELSGEF